MREILEDLATTADVDPIQKARQNMRRELPKRFYKEVTAGEVKAGEGEAGFTILLDGRPVRTPARGVLAVSARAVADALVAEWAAQGTHIDPAGMPLTRLVNSAIDGVAAEVEAVAADVAKYAGSDLLFYRAEAPERLVARQTEGWDPVLAWAEQRFGVRFRLAAGVMPVVQDPAVVPAVLAAVPRDPFRLAALHQMTTLMGSVLLGVAVIEGRLTAEEAFALSQLDEDWNAELWGMDDEATARRAGRHIDMMTAALLAAGDG